MLGISFAVLVRTLAPFGPVERRKERIAGYLRVDLCEVKPLCPRQRLRIEFGAANHEYLWIVTRGRESVVERVRHRAAGRGVTASAGDDNVVASGQWSADRLIVFAPHEDSVPHRQATEMPQIVRQSPRQRVVAADDTVLGHRDNQRDHIDIHTRLNRNRCFDRRVWVVIHQLEVFVDEFIECGHLWV